MTTSGVCRINPNWKQIEVGDPVVSDWFIDGERRFIPFTFRPGHDPGYTKLPGMGYLCADLCFPYGELTDRPYTEHRRHDETV